MGPEQQLVAARTADVLVEELENELVVYDLRSHTAHNLAGLAAAVWRRCDAKTAVSELPEAVGGGAPVTIEAVWIALRELSHVGLLEPGIVFPAEVRTLSRRTLLARGAALGVGVAVLSVAVPAAATVASCTSTVGANCNVNAPCCPPLTCVAGHCQ